LTRAKPQYTTERRTYPPEDIALPQRPALVPGLEHPPRLVIVWHCQPPILRLVLSKRPRVHIRAHQHCTTTDVRVKHVCALQPTILCWDGMIPASDAPHQPT
jgi:hypothetical protein